ncbi:MAG: cytochrome c oxidase subunit II [Anaerolineales bacterium]
MRERTILLIVLLVLGLIAAGVVVGVVVEPLPEIATAEALTVSQALKVFFGIAAAVFLGVEGLLVFAAVRGHLLGKSRGQVSSGLEMVWIALPAVLVGVIVIYSIKALSEIEAPVRDPMVVTVTGKQFEWEFFYVDAGVSSDTLVLPVGSPVELVFTSTDVIHSFWVPAFGEKVDAVPDMDPPASLTVTPLKAGSYRAVCAELCGEGHKAMQAEVLIQDPSAFEAWLGSK